VCPGYRIEPTERTRQTSVPPRKKPAADSHMVCFGKEQRIGNR
jgi:hypothetical protein